MTFNRCDSPDSWDDDDEEGCVDNTGDLDCLPEYSEYSYADGDDDANDDWHIDSEAGQPTTDQDENFTKTLLVTAANPNGSVTATTLMGGQVFRVTLSSQVTRFSEAELANEILAVCTLASRQADAAQHYLVATLMRELGHDPTQTRSFLEHTVGLPSPQTVLKEKTQMFADYYSDRDQRGVST